MKNRKREICTSGSVRDEDGQPPHLLGRRNSLHLAPKIKARLADLGGDVLRLSPADFGKLTADETEKWAKAIRAANIKPD